MLKRNSLITILMALIMTNLFTPPLSATAIGYAYQFVPSPNYTQSDIKALLKISDNTGAGLPTHKVEWKNPQGTTVDCHPQGGGCTIYNDYDGTGTWISSTWEFFISGQQRPSGTYTAIVSDCTSKIGNTCISWAEWFRANFYINNVSYNLFLPLILR